MRFVADESCDFSVVRILRAGGHDVVAITEALPGSDDALVMDLARREQRILITEDKDFGQLVYANMQPSGGVILIRYPAHARKALPGAIVTLIRESSSKIGGQIHCAQSWTHQDWRESRVGGLRLLTVWRLLAHQDEYRSTDREFIAEKRAGLTCENSTSESDVRVHFVNRIKSVGTSVGSQGKPPA